MALNFTVTTTQSLFGDSVASRPITITLTGSGTLASNATFALTGPGTFSPTSATILTGATVGASTTFTFTPTDSGTITVTASGGLVATHTLAILMIETRRTTAMKIITRALTILGVKPVGQPVNGSEALEILDALNSLVDSWRTQSMFAYTTQTITSTLEAGVSSVTIGPSGDIVTPYRPVRIEPGSYFTSGGVDYSMGPMTQGQYLAIGYKTLGTLGPDSVYYESGMPNGTLYFYPQASADVELTLQALTELTEFADLQTAYALSPGYERALAFELANEISSSYDTQLPPSADRSRVIAMREIRRANHRTPALKTFRPLGNILVGWEL